ncbi:MAG: FAD-dependent oxidoreductase [Desulfobacteraceae bacterium]|nr:FAD-dependent oxidoreductase [Desulfobacteraceae bacterium]
MKQDYLKDSMVKKKIVIVGGGAAGVACALSSSSNRNFEIYLLEKTGFLGGTVTHSLIHTIGGLFDASGELLNGGLSTDLIKMLMDSNPYARQRKMGKLWVLNSDPADFNQIAISWIKNQKNIKFFSKTQLEKIDAKDGKVTRVVFRPPNNEAVTVQPEFLVDATGTAEIIRELSPNQVIQGNPLAGFIFRITGVKKDVIQFPKNVAIMRNIRKASADGTLPGACAMTWLDTGTYENEIYLKTNISGSRQDGDFYTDPELSESILNFLKPTPGFSRAHVGGLGKIGIREGGRIRGEYSLTYADLKEGKSFPDAVCRGNWPIEYWDREKGVILEYLKHDRSYDIPLRALKVNGMRNVWAVGKCLSSDPLAQSSARVVGTCWAMGDGLGRVLANLES